MITFSQLGRHGRLGNQMFQYALLLGISERSGFKVGLLDQAGLSAYSLGAHALEAAGMAQFRRYDEPFYHFSPLVFQVGDQVDYGGNYQSEKYFAHARERVQREFALKPEFRARVDAVSTRLRSDGKALVGVHVRRGDFVSLPYQHPPLGIDYYEAAARLIPDAQRSRFVVFSDDPRWSEQWLGFLGEVVVSEWGLSPQEDLALMASCDHNIIANSTFSWWSAWLNPNPEKAVVAPQRWFGPLGPGDRYDLVPGSWRRV